MRYNARKGAFEHKKIICIREIIHYKYWLLYHYHHCLLLEPLHCFDWEMETFWFKNFTISVDYVTLFSLIRYQNIFIQHFNFTFSVFGLTTIYYLFILTIYLNCWISKNCPKKLPKVTVQRAAETHTEQRASRSFCRTRHRTGERLF